MQAVQESVVKESELPNELRKMIDTIPGFVWSAKPDGSVVYLSQRGFEYTGYSFDEIKNWKWRGIDIFHPDDIPYILDAWNRIINSGKPGEIQGRMRRYDGEYLWMLLRVTPLFDENGNLAAWWGIDFEIDKRKKAEDKLRKIEAYIAEAQKLSGTGGFSINISTNELWCSEETFSIAGFETGTKPTVEDAFGRVHPDDKQMVRDILDRCIAEGKYLDYEIRFLMPDGLIKYVHVAAHLIKFNTGSPEVVGAVSDISQMRLAEKKLYQKEMEFRQIVEAVPCLIIVMSSDGKCLYANSKLLDYTGYKQEDVIASNFHVRIFHPDDIDNTSGKRDQALFKGIPFELEQRILGKDGKYRWFLTRFNPLTDDNERVVRWYTTATDIDDRKQHEEKVQKENIALREEIDKSANLDIIGNSKHVQNIHHLISLVALTNSSVLILGETGTGKELVARIIHNSSYRRDKIMIKVNCATLPANLIESELFGHERGSFTGAVERRIGKFELANHSTLFLDEVGELPLGLQVKLLRVLQEKEFERVGGKETIKIDVRIIAASNKNLQKEVKDGNFRKDLYYRLNVFPITVPPLRERKNDIPILADHFLAKYSKNIGKKINNISNKAMEELISYNWPGNVRELEHLIERSVILNNDTINEILLPQIEPIGVNDKKDSPIKTIHQNEHDYILSVLKKCKGKKAGTDGAAVLLGVPVSTLNSKIKKLGITKEQIYSSQQSC